jgi:membrane protein YqaA with SNARE-associated domain
MNIIDYLFQLGYPGLLIISFLSASFVPLGSEVFIIAMPGLGFNVPFTLAVATTGHYLGALTNYYIGKKGGHYLLIQKLNFNPRHLDLVGSWIDRWGEPILVLSWLPIIGDPLAGIAGLFHINLWKFSFWIILGKALRNLVILGIGDMLWKVFLG